MPKITVIIPTYNRGYIIRHSINSVLNQTYKNFELIIVDDGSTDDTKEVVSSIKDDRLIFIQHSKNKGANASRNTGIRNAKGKYIAFQDSDDIWVTNKLELQVKIMADSPYEIGVVYSGLYLIKDGTKIYVPYHRITKINGYLYPQLLKENFVGTQTMLIRKSCISKSHLFDEQLSRLQDWDFVIRLSKNYKFVCINEPLVTVYRNFDSISNDKLALILSLEKIIEKYYDEFKKAKELPGHYFNLFKLLFMSREYGITLKYIAQKLHL